MATGAIPVAGDVSVPGCVEFRNFIQIGYLRSDFTSQISPGISFAFIAFWRISHVTAKLEQGDSSMQIMRKKIEQLLAEKE